MKEITIHKDNELIKYELTKYLKPESFNILDYLYHKTQKHINEEKKKKIVLYKEYTILIPQAELRKWLEIKSKSYVETIRKSLKELSQEIDLFNYEDTDGKFVDWGLKSFIEKPRQYKQKNGRAVFELTLNPFLFNIIINIIYHPN